LLSLALVRASALPLATLFAARAFTCFTYWFSSVHNDSFILYIEFNPSNNLGYSGFYFINKLIFSFADAALHNYFFLLL
jgi:hypothetical protein